MNAVGGIPSYVVDTSVVLKWFLETEEADVAEARALRATYLRGQCLLRAPDFLFLEVANALTTRQGSRAERVKEALNALGEIGLWLAPLRDSTLSRAVELAASLHVTVYDTYFLALADQTGSRLVTADERFLRRALPNPNVVALRLLRHTGIDGSL